MEKLESELAAWYKLVYERNISVDGTLLLVCEEPTVRLPVDGLTALVGKVTVL
jgi:hypothetical protein